MGVSREELVVAVVAVALGFAPTTANATTIEQAIRIEATAPTEKPPTPVQQAVRIAEAVATENLTVMRDEGRVVRGMGENIAQRVEEIIEENLDVDVRDIEPEGVTEDLGTDDLCDGPVDLGDSGADELCQEAAVPSARLSLAAKMQVRGNVLAARFRAQAEADANQEKPQ